MSPSLDDDDVESKLDRGDFRVDPVAEHPIADAPLDPIAEPAERLHHVQRAPGSLVVVRLSICLTNRLNIFLKHQKFGFNCKVLKKESLFMT